MLSVLLAVPRTPLYKRLKEAGRLLSLSAGEAVRLGVADAELPDEAAVLAAAGAGERAVFAHAASRSERLLRFLGMPAVASLLLLMMMGGLYFELQTPGVGLAGAVAVVGALLFFAPHYLLGLVESWEIIVFLLGITLLVVEIFVTPGFGLFGITGLVLTFGALGAALSAGALGSLACSGEEVGQEGAPLLVGGLPVTCNLTLPVACRGKQISNGGAAPGSARFQYEYSKYSGWPEIKESLMAGRIQAGYMLAPLVMDLADKKIPVKIVSLGHRSGAVIMVREDSSYQHFTQLRGKRIAIPSRFAVDYLFLRKMLARENMTPADIEIMEMPPPDMPAALYANAVDAYCTGEPFGASAQSAGYARVLRMTRDEWRNYICCVLTVRQELIDENPAMVQDLVNQVQGAGVWLDQQQSNRDKAVQIAAGKDFFNQDPKILQFVMENPTDRVTYGDLRMIREEFEDLMQLSIEAGTIKHPIPYATYIDERFAKATRAAAIPL